MSENIEELKKKIIYRASYRGTKEMDILMINFVKFLIDKLNISLLKDLNKLVNLGDEDLIRIKKKELLIKDIDSLIIKHFIDFE